MPEPQHHTTRIEKTAHYSTLGEANVEVRYLWIICHGYGQLARNIIHKFSDIYTPQHLFIAPEGLSRFYWNEAKGQVGASWMTSQDRLHEIDDYADYLQQLYTHNKARCHPEVQVIAFGFSQGVATIWRWLMAHQPTLTSVIMWAGLTPEDIVYLPHKAYLEKLYIELIYGTSDQYLTQERMDLQMQLERDQNLHIEHYSFEGKHQISRDFLAIRAANWLSKK